MRLFNREMRSINPGYGQFRWVVLLLAVAVILPTACLLWFMSEVVKNEHLVVRQRLTAFYKNRLADVTKDVGKKWADYCRVCEEGHSALHAYEHVLLVTSQDGYDGLIVYDAAGSRLYPVLSTDTGTFTRPSEVFADAWELEFVARDYERAVERYEQYARISDNHGRLAARIGKSRCLARLDRLDEAINESRRVAFSPLAQTDDAHSLALIANARLLLLNWTEEQPEYRTLFVDTFRRLLTMLYRPNSAGAALPADQNLFIAQKVLDIGREHALRDKDAALLRGASLEKLIIAEERSIAFSEVFPSADTLEDWQEGTLQPLAPQGDASYAVMHKTPQRTCVSLLSRSSVVRVLSDFANELQDAYVDHRILDDTERFICGLDGPKGEPFATGPVGEYFPGWTAQLYFKGGDVFERAASEQIAVYIWTGVLVILLILLSGAVAAKSIGKQVKLNKLKNDFIATVTHELKTPLASMRVLVDTLLEGNYRDRQQVTEYLQLVSRENERLTRLIDNFLTFSRMERNKQAFQMRETKAAAVARAAAEAVQTKLGRGNCHFETEIPENLPDIMADQDAMVTVLVNLLDNAYKYSYDQKRIKLSVTTEDGTVCFTVCDNGVGIPYRAARKIFRRFYQVDRSLSRRAEGCGLGLSIAKFIVDAHLGSISVDSKPGQGSTFTVRLPARENHKTERTLT